MSNLFSVVERGLNSLVLGKLLHALKQVSGDLTVQVLSHRCTVGGGGVGHGESGIRVLRGGTRRVLLAIGAQRCTDPRWSRARRIGRRRGGSWGLGTERVSCQLPNFCVHGD